MIVPKIGKQLKKDESFTYVRDLLKCCDKDLGKVLNEKEIFQVLKTNNVSLSKNDQMDFRTDMGDRHFTLE